MENAFHTSLIVLSIAYTVLWVAYARLFAGGADGVARFPRQILRTVLFLHFVSVLLAGAMERACPLASPGEFLSMISFSMVVIYAVMEGRIKVPTTGVFVVIPAFLLEVVATVWILGQEERPAIRLSVATSFHSFAAVVAFSAVTICGVYGLLYLFLYGAIKRGRFGLFFRKMPPLEKLTDLNFAATTIAFLALCVMIAIGLHTFFSEGRSAGALIRPEVLLTGVLWLVYGASIAARRLFGLGGKRLAYVTLLGSLLMGCAVFANLYGKGFHKW